MNELVSVIILAYNESSTLEKAVDSVLSQSYANLEILICDNASEDDTLAMALRCSSRDSRIKVVSRERNIGAPANLYNAVQSAQGKYFLFCGAHDLISSNYIEELMSCLNGRRDAVLAMGKTIWLDLDGNKVDKYSSLLDTSSLSALGRYLSLMFQNQHYLYGLISRDAFLSCRHNTPPITPGSGELVLQELSAKGVFVCSTRATWYRGVPRVKESAGRRLFRYKNVLNQSQRYRILFSFFPMLQYGLFYLLLPWRIFPPLTATKVFAVSFPIILLKAPALLASDLLFYVFLLRRVILKA